MPPALGSLRAPTGQKTQASGQRELISICMASSFGLPERRRRMERGKRGMDAVCGVFGAQSRKKVRRSGECGV